MADIPDIRYEYLIGAAMIKGKPNTYYGSVSLKENPGIFDDCFRYCLTVLVPEDAEKSVSASCFVGWQAFDVADKTAIVQKLFPPDENGAVQAVEWLRSEIEKVR